MSISRRFGFGAGGMALLLSSVSPAYAGWGMGVGRSWGGGWNSSMSWGSGWGGGRHHGRGGDDSGEIIGGMLLGAILMGAISSSKKKARQRDRDYGDYPEQDNRANDSSQRSRGKIATEDEAADACAYAAEDKGGRSASVRDINRVDKSSDGWDVEGIIETRDGWRDRSADRHRFTCSVRYGAVDSVYIEDGKVALAD